MTIDQAADNATSYLRQVHTALADKMTPAECHDMLQQTGDDAMLEDLGAAAFPAPKAMVVLWAMQAHAGGYDPEQCRVTFVPSSNDIELPWKPALTCELNRK